MFKKLIFCAAVASVPMSALVKITDEDSVLIFDVLEAHDDGLTVRGKSGTFKINPPSPESW